MGIGGENMENLKEIYKGEGYEKRIESEKSACEIVPFLWKLFRPKSVVDVGGGVGTWLEAFQRCGEYIRLCCVEGEYVRKNYRISTDTLIEKDLEQKIDLAERFDMAVSLEVAEHLSKERADTFISDLVKLSDIIVLSAAIPFQPGDHHVNCQDSSYWKKLFENQNYKRIDCIRPLIVNNPNVAWWYKNNIFIYVKAAMYEDVCRKITSTNMMIWPDSIGDFVHYECFYNIVEMQKGITRNEEKVKTDLLLKWIKFNKNCSIDEWIQNNLRGVQFAIFGLGAIGKIFASEILDSKNKEMLKAIIDNYTNEDRWEETQVFTLPEFLELDNDVKVVINTIFSLEETMKNKIKQKGMKIIDLKNIFE